MDDKSTTTFWTRGDRDYGLPDILQVLRSAQDEAHMLEDRLHIEAGRDFWSEVRKAFRDPFPVEAPGGESLVGVKVRVSEYVPTNMAVVFNQRDEVVKIFKLQDSEASR